MKIIASILLALSFSASAESTYLYTEVSEIGETMDAFVLRIAKKANAYTNETWHEVCAEIANDDDRYVSAVYTSGKKYECEIPHVRDGSSIFHTHPNGAHPEFSEKDYYLPGYLIMKSVVLHQQGRGTQRFIGKFSIR